MKAFVKNVRSIGIRLGFVALIVLFYRCPFRMIFDMDCPGCGLTRAMLSALRLDFKAAFSYHPLFLVFGIVFCYALFADYIGKVITVPRKVEVGCFAGFMALLLIVWVIRQFII